MKIEQLITTKSIAQVIRQIVTMKFGWFSALVLAGMAPETVIIWAISIGVLAAAPHVVKALKSLVAAKPQERFSVSASDVQALYEELHALREEVAEIDHVGRLGVATLTEHRATAKTVTNMSQRLDDLCRLTKVGFGESKSSLKSLTEILLKDAPAPTDFVVDELGNAAALQNAAPAKHGFVPA